MRRFAGLFRLFLSDYDVLAALQTGSRYNQLKQWAVIAESVADPLISSHYKHRRCVAIARRHRRGSKCMPDRRELSNKPCFAVRMSCSESLLRYQQHLWSVLMVKDESFWLTNDVFSIPYMTGPCIRAM